MEEKVYVCGDTMLEMSCAG